MDESSILVIDDDPDVLDTIVGVLENAGYSSIVRADARQAELILRDRTFAVIVSDVVMPHLTGIELLELAKQHNPHAEVLLVTAYTTRNMIAEAMEKGASGVIDKPFDTAQLVAAVGEACRRARLRSGAGPLE